MKVPQFMKFLLAGGFAAAVNFGSRIGLSELMPYVPAIVLAYMLGMVTAFVLNRSFVFRQSTNQVAHQASWFVAINLAAVLQTVAISVLLARVVFPALGVTYAPETVAHAIGVVIPVFTSYLGHKHLTFRGQRA